MTEILAIVFGFLGGVLSLLFESRITERKHFLELQKREKRLEVVMNLQSLLVELNYSLGAFMHATRGKDIEALNDKLIMDFQAFRDFYHKNKILLGEKHCILIDEIISKTAFAKYWQSYKKFSGDEFFEKWEESVQIVMEEIPSMRKSLEAEFRKILGIV